MTDENNRNAFLAKLGIHPSSLAMGRQVHGSVVVVVDAPANNPLDGVDGLVFRKNGSVPVAVAVRVADCVPLLFFDKQTKTVAAAHAGWKGTVGHIGTNVVEVMKDMGSKATDIVVCVGPHIGACCYKVPEGRVEAFIQAFGDDKRLAYKEDGQWHLDIAYANLEDLLNAGIPQSNIDAQVFCTSCQKHMYFSYRGDTDESFGEMLGVIAGVTS